MKPRRILAPGGAILLVVLCAAAVASAAGPKVSVRVEGATRTLLGPTDVSVPSSGSITKGGTPRGVCPANTAAGAFDVATHHRWGGTYSSGLGVDVTKILGETHTYSKGSYWSIWIDNRYAQVGMCDLKLHRGDQLLFAPYPATGAVYPIILGGPSQVRVGAHVTLTATYYAGSKLKPLAGVRIHGGGFSAVSDRHGRVGLVIAHAGTLVLHADEHGYIRAAPLSLHEHP